MIDFYDVDKKYIEFLKQAEIVERGFTCVPNMEYGEHQQKFLCGVILEIDRIKYYVPVSSNKKDFPDSIPINIPTDKYNQRKGTLRFNYMIPVPDCAIFPRIIKQEPDEKRRNFLWGQLSYCRTIEQKICSQANRTRKKWFGGYGSKSFYQNCCDFKLLESKCVEYSERQSTITF